MSLYHKDFKFVTFDKRKKEPKVKVDEGMECDIYRETYETKSNYIAETIGWSKR